ncbi:MAG TPA: ATP-binding cassette domain-containing protein [Clostridia bacterium]|jgi:ABC-type multidrug transport system ATPase subunit|nr:ATP-binding cassette domain-containing protein [Clostridia bacterium]
MSSIIEIDNLKKYFGDVKAVDGISFSVERGSLFAFLGLNGAGKSTTINILCTLLKKDHGDVVIDGYNLDRGGERIRESIGIVFQNSVLDARLTVKENLTVRASYYGYKGEEWKTRLTELTDLLELDEILPRPYGKLSGGQKRRVDIARGLIHRPKILFLDEPTTGLDPKTRQSVWQIVNNLRLNTGMTVFLTTHYMEEANEANNVVILDCGRIAAVGTPHNLKNEYSGDYIKLYTHSSDEVEDILKAEDYSYRYENDCYMIRMSSSVSAKEFILRHPDMINDFEVVKGDMDDVFLNATGKKLEGGAL